MKTKYALQASGQWRHPCPECGTATRGAGALPCMATFKIPGVKWSTLELGVATKTYLTDAGHFVVKKGVTQCFPLTSTTSPSIARRSSRRF